MALAEFVVMFRESLEIALLVGIMAAYLRRTGNRELEKHIYAGALAGIVVSIALAYAFQYVEGGFDASEPLFEGIVMLFSSALVSWLLFWMLMQQNIAREMQDEVRNKIAGNEAHGIFLLAFVATLREGVEAVLFMAGIFFNTGALSVGAGFLGAIVAVLLGVLVFGYAIKFNIKLFLQATALLLVLLAAGLFSQSLNELQEAKILPTWVEHVYNINPMQNPDGSYPPLHEKGSIGEIFKGLIGYDGDPSDLQVLGYVSYLAAVYILYKKQNSQKQRS